MATPIRKRSKVAFCTSRTMGESGWASRVANVQAEIMNSPRPLPSLAYSGQCSVSFCLHRDTTEAFAAEITLQSLTGIQRSFPRSEEHTSELQSRLHLVCRLLLEKKKKKSIDYNQMTNDCNYS